MSIDVALMGVSEFKSSGGCVPGRECDRLYSLCGFVGMLHLVLMWVRVSLGWYNRKGATKGCSTNKRYEQEQLSLCKVERVLSLLSQTKISLNVRYNTRNHKRIVASPLGRECC